MLMERADCRFITPPIRQAAETFYCLDRPVTVIGLVSLRPRRSAQSRGLSITLGIIDPLCTAVNGKRPPLPPKYGTAVRPASAAPCASPAIPPRGRLVRALIPGSVVLPRTKSG